MIGTDWTPHRRDDGELLGWIRPDGEDWTAVDQLGPGAAAQGGWLDAAAGRGERGLGYLADVWMLEDETDRPLRVRMVEVTPAHIVVKVDDFGDVGRATARFELTWPLPDRLRPPRDGDPDGFTLSG